ncbi:hypothetical protein C7S13_4546 [Burkholderia cepacia]|nr:hypothetical protein [Burkholderia cepacia]
MIESTDYARRAARMAPVASTSPLTPDRALRMPCRAAPRSRRANTLAFGHATSRPLCPAPKDPT